MGQNPFLFFDKNILHLADLAVLNLEMTQINTLFFFTFRAVAPNLF